MTTLLGISPIVTAKTKHVAILVVDDDDATVKLLGLAFERAGARVIGATSGAQALRQTFEQRPDVVVRDLNMPEMDGLTVCRRLHELSDVPIIMITAFDDIDNVTTAFAAGVDDFVAKPFDTFELLARVQACLRRATKNTETDGSLVLGKGDLVIDLRRHSIWVRQQTIHSLGLNLS